MSCTHPLHTQSDLHVVLSRNTVLAQRYRRTLSEFIRMKTLALEVMEKRLDLEGALHDHKQVSWACAILRYNIRLPVCTPTFAAYCLACKWCIALTCTCMEQADMYTCTFACIVGYICILHMHV